MPAVNLKIFVKVLVDVSLLIAVGLPILLFYYIGTPFQRGFFCNDVTIRYPFKNSTVTSGALYAFGTIIPIVSILLIEFFHTRKADNSSIKRNAFRQWFWSLYRYVGVFLFGCAISHLTVDICKYSIGRLRPHFIDVCNPDWSKVDCEVEGMYISEDICNQEDKHLLKEARLSFISGHASFSTYTMFYLIFYLQYRLLVPRFHLVRPVFQYLCFGVAVFTTLSRIADYKHHWADILTGFFNGLVFALFCAFWVAEVHSKKCRLTQVEDVNLRSLNSPLSENADP